MKQPFDDRMNENYDKIRYAFEQETLAIDDGDHRNSYTISECDDGWIEFCERYYKEEH